MRTIGDLLAPLRCVSCGSQADGELCAPCARRLVPIVQPMCRRCGAPHAMRPVCCAGLDGFDRARSLVAYGGPSGRLALALKRRGRGGLAAAVGGLLADLARSQGIDGDMVTWVPAGASAAWKGFDHAELLAREVASRLGLPALGALIRVREGSRQSEAPLELRRTNARGRFAAREGLSGGAILVDDVFTTGATAEACALALLSSGMTRVHVLTWARTLRRLAILAG